MSRTVAITGATGFIGSVIARRLATTGWRIKALVRSASFNKRQKDLPIEWVNGDLEDMASLHQLVEGADAIVHCAGAVRGASQADFDRVNVDGLARLVKVAAEQKPAPSFLLLSSLAAREPTLSYYASSKFHGEKTLATCSDEMFWGVLRPPAVYGPGDKEMLPLFKSMFRGIAPLIGCEKNRVSLLYVEDLANAVICWLDRGKHQHRLYELHDGHLGGYSWQEIIGTVEGLRGKAILKAKIPVSLVKILASINLVTAKAFGGSPMLTPEKVRELIHPDWVADNTLLHSDTGWTPHVSLEEGLRQIFVPGKEVHRL